MTRWELEDLSGVTGRGENAEGTRTDLKRPYIKVRSECWGNLLTEGKKIGRKFPGEVCFWGKGRGDRSGFLRGRGKTPGKLKGLWSGLSGKKRLAVKVFAPTSNGKEEGVVGETV